MYMSKTFKLLRCHPKKNKKNNNTKKVNDSCYDDETIILLKNEWNKKNLNNKIISTDINKIWYDLKNKILKCENELCWLDELVTNIKKKEIKKKSFVPIAPINEWKKYNNWLSSTEFNEIMEQYMETYPEFLYLGPSPIDFEKIVDGKCVWPTLCNLNVIEEQKKGKTKFGIILNLDKHNGGGSHWVCLFVELIKKYIIYFESTGSTMPDEVKNFIKKIKDQCLTKGIVLNELNNMHIRHQKGTSECGMYCLYVVITLLEETHTPNYFLLKNKIIPDKKMNDFRNIYFNNVKI